MRNIESEFIALTNAFAVYSQLVFKWQVGNAGPLPARTASKMFLLLRTLLNPWVLSAFCAVFLAFLAWMAPMAMFEFNHAHPFIGLNFMLPLAFSNPLFHESIASAEVPGIALIILEILVGSRG